MVARLNWVHEVGRTQINLLQLATKLLFSGCDTKIYSIMAGHTSVVTFVLYLNYLHTAFYAWYIIYSV